MNVILCEDVDNLGSMGDQVKVANGYARNFLLPRKLAVVADSASAKQIEHELRIIRKREAKLRVELTEVSKTIADLNVAITTKAGENGKLFGSVTTLHIAAALKELGHEVNRRKIKLAEPIKTVGKHQVVLKLGAGVETTINVEVIANIVKTEKVEEVHEVELDDDDDVGTMADMDAAKAAAPAKAAKAAARAAAKVAKAEAKAARAEAKAAKAAEGDAPAEDAATAEADAPAEDTATTETDAPAEETAAETTEEAPTEEVKEESAE